MTRTLVVEPSGNLWGSERALLDMCHAMPAPEVAVCCPPGKPLNGELTKLQIRTLPYYISNLHQRSRWRRLQCALGVIRACLEFRPDVIYLNQSGSYKVVLPAATLLNLPIVAHIRIFQDAAYLARQAPQPHRLRCLIAISSAVETEIARFRGLAAIPVHRIYDAYSSFNRVLSTSSTNRTANRVACVGRLELGKGQDVLLRAIGVLKKSGTSVEGVIVGDGEASFVIDLKQIASIENVASSIRWAGLAGDVVTLLQTCSVLACPSHREGLGRVIFEAWDAGAIPVAFSGSGGAAEIIAAAEGGILYEEQTPESLARALKNVLELDQDERTRLVNNGRLWMAKNCDPKLYGETVSKILGSAAQGHSL